MYMTPIQGTIPSQMVWQGGGGQTWSHLEAIREFGSLAQELAAESRRVRRGASGRQPLALTASRMLSSESRRLEDLSRVRSSASSSTHAAGF